MVMAAYETPVGYVTEDRGDFSVQVADDIEGWKPLLAEKVDISEDRKVLTFHLRGGVRFYPSGNEMTADDWIWAWERQLSDPPLGWGIFENQQASITDIDQITKVDEYTVRITLNEPNPLALPFMRFQMFAVYDSEEVRKHVTEEDPWAAEWLSKNTAGTGPYYVESWRPGERVVLERNPYYWGEPPAYETVEIHIVPEESTRLALLDRGDIMLTNDVSPELARRFGEKEGIDMYSIPSGNRVYIGFNVGRDPYSDRSLREGVAYAVPYGEILEDIYEGYGRRYRSFVLPELEGYTPEGFDYDTDLERAREHFESLGEPREVPTLFVNAGSVLEREAAAIIQDYLARADFPVEVRALPSGEFTSRLFAKDLPFFITSGVSWIDDPSTIAGLWMVSGAYGNFTGFSNPEVDRIQDEWQYRKPSPEREEAYREAQRLYNRAVNVVYLVLADHLVVQSDAVTNYTYYKDTATRYQDLRPGD
jgi:peptide/nickel transport system substrate-binding protein